MRSRSGRAISRPKRDNRTRHGRPTSRIRTIPDAVSKVDVVAQAVRIVLAAAERRVLAEHIVEARRSAGREKSLARHGGDDGSGLVDGAGGKAADVVEVVGVDAAGVDDVGIDAVV
jgi:hypothetical protein